MMICVTPSVSLYVLLCPFIYLCPHMSLYFLICPYMSGQGWGWYVGLPVCPYMSARACPTVHSLPRYLVLSSHSVFLSFCSKCKCICIHVFVYLYLFVSICMCANTFVCFYLLLWTCIYALTISSYPVILHSYPFLMCLCATAHPTYPCLSYLSTSLQQFISYFAPCPFWRLH